MSFDGALAMFFCSIQVVRWIHRHTRDGRPIYPMLKAIKISLILASDLSTAIKIVMNIDESGFRRPIYPMLKAIKIAV